MYIKDPPMCNWAMWNVGVADARDNFAGLIALLAENPRPPGAKALQGRPRLRGRVGNYCIIYPSHDDVLLIIVVSLGPRSGVDERQQGRSMATIAHCPGGESDPR